MTIMGGKGTSAGKAPLRKQDLVYDAVRRDILAGVLRPGERLRIDEISSSLEVSHIPVREALKVLEADGYVSIEPYGGTTVADLKADWIHEVFEVKESLEQISGRAACKRMTMRDLGDLEEILRQMDDLTGDPEAWSQANVRLHRLITDRANMKLVGQLLDKVLNQWDRLRRFYLQEVFGQRLAVAQAEHWEIFRALRERDEQRLQQVIRGHNREALAAYASHLRVDE